eukprot:SAG11_NODE_11398_length_763_cov_1.314759_1_plen_43_part_10
MKVCRRLQELLTEPARTHPAGLEAGLEVEPDAGPDAGPEAVPE